MQCGSGPGWVGSVAVGRRRRRRGRPGGRRRGRRRRSATRRRRLASGTARASRVGVGRRRRSTVVGDGASDRRSGPGPAIRRSGRSGSPGGVGNPAAGPGAAAAAGQARQVGRVRRVRRNAASPAVRRQVGQVTTGTSGSPGGSGNAGAAEPRPHRVPPGHPQRRLDRPCAGRTPVRVEEVGQPDRRERSPRTRTSPGPAIALDTSNRTVRVGRARAGRSAITEPSRGALRRSSVSSSHRSRAPG